MAIYRVTGEAPATMLSREVFVRAPSLESALEVAHTHIGLNKVSGEPATAEEALGHPILSSAQERVRPDALRFIARSSLVTSPILTITIGVFFGMLLSSVVTVVLVFFLGEFLSNF